MVRRSVILAACTALLGLGAASIALAARGRVYVANRACTGHAYRPSNIIIACGDGNFYAAKLHYSSYGRSQAVATGRLWENDCNPACYDGHFHSYPGRIRLSHIATCQGRRYYEEISWRFLDGTSPNPTSTGKENITPMACP